MQIFARYARAGEVFSQTTIMAMPGVMTNAQIQTTMYLAVSIVVKTFSDYMMRHSQVITILILSSVLNYIVFVTMVIFAKKLILGG